MDPIIDLMLVVIVQFRDVDYKTYFAVLSHLFFFFCFQGAMFSSIFKSEQWFSSCSKCLSVFLWFFGQYRWFFCTVLGPDYFQRNFGFFCPLSTDISTIKLKKERYPTPGINQGCVLIPKWLQAENMAWCAAHPRSPETHS